MLEVTAPSTVFGGLRVPDVVVRPRYVPYTAGLNDTPLLAGTLVEFYLRDAASGGEVWKDDAAFLDLQNPKCGFNNVFVTSGDNASIVGISIDGAPRWGTLSDVMFQGVCTAGVYILEVSLPDGTFPAGTLLYGYSGNSGTLSPPLSLIVPEAGSHPIAMLLAPISFQTLDAKAVNAKVLIKQPLYGSGAG